MLELTDHDLAQDDVDVAVDQARHQRPAAAIRDHGIPGADRPVGDLADRAALDQQFEAAADLVPLGIEHLKFLNRCWAK